MAYQTPPATGKPALRPGIGSFLAWTVVGAGLCVGFLTMLTIGIFVVPAALGAGVLVLRSRGGRTASAAGVLAGIGVVPLYVAYLNRQGPGNICTTTLTGGACITEWSPWPWIIAGLLLVAAGIGLFLWLRRSASSHFPDQGSPKAA
jgi:hypothetical protein